MKGRMILLGMLACLAVLSVGITYSFYSSDGRVSGEVRLASFVIGTEELTEISFPLSDLLPGKSVVHNFSVTNEVNGKLSEVSIEYEIILKTQLLIPLTYKLSNITSTEELLFTCDNTVVRDAENIVVCKSDPITMAEGAIDIDNFKLEILFPGIYSDVMYAGLVDYVDIEINSWQKTN